MDKAMTLRDKLFNAIWRCGFAPHEDPAVIEKKKAEWPDDVVSVYKRADAVLSVLSALKEDPEVVERIGKAMLADELAARPHRDFDETWAQEDLIWLSNARAALSAIEVE